MESQCGNILMRIFQNAARLTIWLVAITTRSTTLVVSFANIFFTVNYNATRGRMENGTWTWLGRNFISWRKLEDSSRRCKYNIVYSKSLSRSMNLGCHLAILELEHQFLDEWCPTQGLPGNLHCWSKEAIQCWIFNFYVWFWFIKELTIFFSDNYIYQQYSRYKVISHCSL